MADNNRLDFGDLGDDLLKDIQAAAEEVKQRTAADKAKEARQAQHAKTRKSQAIMIAVGAVVVLLLAYWMIFARNADTGPTHGPLSPGASNNSAPINVPAATRPAPRQRTQPMGTRPGGGSQTTTRQPDSYEQPNDNPM